MRKFAVAAVALLALCSTAAGGEVSGKGPNGGRMADATIMHVEFLSKGAEVFVYTYDHDNKPVAIGRHDRTIDNSGKGEDADRGLDGGSAEPAHRKARCSPGQCCPGDRFSHPERRQAGAGAIHGQLSERVLPSKGPLGATLRPGRC